MLFRYLPSLTPNHLLQDVLLPHELLPLPVGLSNNNIQHILSIVWYIADKKYQVLQQLDHEPAREVRVSTINK